MTKRIRFAPISNYTHYLKPNERKIGSSLHILSPFTLGDWPLAGLRGSEPQKMLFIVVYSSFIGLFSLNPQALHCWNIILRKDRSFYSAFFGRVIFYDSTKADLSLARVWERMNDSFQVPLLRLLNWLVLWLWTENLLNF